MAIISFLALISPIHAQTVVDCESCISTSQYEAAAIGTHGTFSGTRQYVVINISRKEMKYIDVQYVKPGYEIQGNNNIHTDDRVNGQGKGGGMILTPSASEGILSDVTNAEIVLAGTTGYIVSTSDPSAPERAQFAAMVSVSSSSTFFTMQPGVLGFDSFNSAYYDYKSILGAQIWAALSVNHPAWNGTYINPSSLNALWNSLKTYFGKGPSACIVFYNGDSACFQANPLASSAVMYIEGTAMDINGNPILSITPNVPNGGNTGMTMHPNNPRTGYSGWSVGSWWIICSTIGGKADKCYAQWVPL